MASSANPNPHQHQQQQPITPFDMQTFFNSIPQSQTPTSPFPPPYSFPPQSSPFHHQQQQQQPQQPQQQQQHMPYHHHHPQFLQNQNAPLLHSQRSLSYPTPPLQPPITISTSASSPSPNPNSGGARLMALLGNIPSPPSNHDPPPQPPQPQPPQHHTPPPSPTPPMMGITLPPPPLHTAGSGPIRMPSSKIPKGRHLVGEHVVYDVDVRLQGESPPQQLEVTPITKYQSDPQLVVGRQIAVNKAYICYGLRQGNIRVLNINTALRSLLRGHTQV